MKVLSLAVVAACLVALVVAAPGAADETGGGGGALAAAAAEAEAGVAVAAAVEEESAVEGDGTDDNVAAEGKSKRTVAAMLGYGHATNALPGGDHRHYVHPHHSHLHAYQQQTQYSHPSQQQYQQYQQYHTLRYYPSKAAAEQATSAPSGGRPHYQIQYTAYVPPPTTSSASAATPSIQYTQGSVAPQLVQVPLASAPQPVVAYQHQAASPAAPTAHSQSLYAASQQLIPVVILRVSDPAQHGLATAALVPASALGLGLGLPLGLPLGLGVQSPHPLHSLLLAQQMQQLQQQQLQQQQLQQQQLQQQQQQHVYYSADASPQLTQQQLKQLYQQQQAAAAAAAGASAAEPKKTAASSIASPPQKPRKSSVSIEPAQSVDGSYSPYKPPTTKDKH